MGSMPPLQEPPLSFTPKNPRSPSRPNEALRELSVCNQVRMYSQSNNLDKVAEYHETPEAVQPQGVIW